VTKDQWTEVVHDSHNLAHSHYMEMLRGILNDWHLDQLDRDKALDLCREDRDAWKESFNECMSEMRNNV